MSRSIHTTWRSLAQLRRQDFSDPQVKAELLREAQRNLRRKHRIKVKVQDERHRIEPPLAGTSPESLPIEVLDMSAHVHYPLSPEDLRSLISALPSAATEGISRIQLSLGKEEMEENRDNPTDEDERDPFTGRAGWQTLPGIYTGDVLGIYNPWDGHIALYAYVYEEAALSRLPLPPEAIRAYLRLHALKTFIHEVAHHHDRTQRVRRGRWIADRTASKENYAERMEHEWTHEIGIPWLECRFPKETAALVEWLRAFGGIKVPLSFFAGDPRRTSRNGMEQLGLSTDYAFESFVKALAKETAASTPSPETHLAFAWEAHYVDEYELCIRILDGVLKQQPQLIKALGCKADTLVHLERLDEAWDLAGRILQMEPSDSAAWEARARVHEVRSKWQDLLDLCTTWEGAISVSTSDWRIAHFRAIACCALERWQEMEHWIGIRTQNFPPPRVKAIRRRIYRRAGKTFSESETLS